MSSRRKSGQQTETRQSGNALVDDQIIDRARILRRCDAQRCIGMIVGKPVDGEHSMMLQNTVTMHIYGRRTNSFAHRSDGGWTITDRLQRWIQRIDRLDRTAEA